MIFFFSSFALVSFLLSPELICVIKHLEFLDIWRWEYVSFISCCLIEILQTNPFCLYHHLLWTQSSFPQSFLYDLLDA